MALKSIPKGILESYHSRERGSLGKVLGVFFLIFGYGYSVFQESFWSDDYPLLVDPNGTFKEVFADARPIYGLLLKFSYLVIGEPQNAWILRLVSLAGLIVLYLIIVTKLDSKNWQIPILVAIGFMLPSFQMYVMWAGCWPHLWTSILSITSYQYWGRSPLKFKLISLCLMALAFSIYPPTTFFTFAYLFLLAYYKEYNLSKVISEFRNLLILFIIGCSIGLTGSLISMHIFEIDQNPRVGTVTFQELPQKVIWIVTRPIVTGFRPFMIDSPSAISALASSVLFVFLFLVGIYFQSKKLNENYFKRFTVLSALLFSSLIPLLIVKDNQIEFRTIAGFSWGVFIVGLIFLQEKKFLKNIKFSRYLSSFFIFLALSVGMYSINMNYKQLFRDPYVIKNQFLESELLRCKQNPSFKSILILDSLKPYPSRNRLGVYSTITDLAHPWVIEPNLVILSRKFNINLPIFFSPRLDSDSNEQCIISLENFRMSLLQNRG
jgi:hypothetical protein